MDWREHVEWLDGNKEDSGDTNRIYLHFFFNESCRKMVSSSRSRHKNRECWCFKYFINRVSWRICTFNSFIGNEGRMWHLPLAGSLVNKILTERTGAKKSIYLQVDFDIGSWFLFEILDVMCRFFFSIARRGALRSVFELNGAGRWFSLQARLSFQVGPWREQGDLQYFMVSWRRNSSVSAEQCSRLGFWSPGKGARGQAGRPSSWVEYATLFVFIWF